MQPTHFLWLREIIRRCDVVVASSPPAVMTNSKAIAEPENIQFKAGSSAE